MPSYTISEIICRILQTRDIIQLYHWKTKSFARHKASDELVQSLTSNMDRFVEAYLGANPDDHVSIKKSINIETFTDKQISSVLYDLLDYLKDLSTESRAKANLLRSQPKGIKVVTTDLLNIRDDMMSDIHKALYLFTLA